MSIYQLVDRHLNRKNRQFKCNKCETFNLQFIPSRKCDKTNQDTVTIDTYSMLVHFPSCESKDTKPKRSVYKCLHEYPLLIDLVKRQQIVKPNKNLVNHELFIIGLCLGEGVVTHRTINRVVASLKSSLIGTQHII